MYGAKTHATPHQWRKFQQHVISQQNYFPGSLSCYHFPLDMVRFLQPASRNQKHLFSESRQCWSVS